jgi:plastocyanin domain-containing protein
MTQTWTTEDAERSTDWPVSSITVGTKEFTTALGNKTTSHLNPGMQQHSTPLSWPLILGIAAGVVGGFIGLALIGLLIWWMCAVKPIRGFYSVVKQNNISLHSQA